MRLKLIGVSIWRICFLESEKHTGRYAFMKLEKRTGEYAFFENVSHCVTKLAQY